MTTTGMIYDFIDSIAPFDTQMDFDNSGLLIGSRQRQVSKVMLALDAGAKVIEQAAAQGCQLLITHHPVIFRPVSRISGDSMVYRLISSGIDVISAHTNLDIAEGGVNTNLSGLLGLDNACRPEWLECGECGTLPKEMTAEELGQYAAERIGCRATLAADGGRPIRKVGVIGGSGGSDWRELASHVDALVTGEAKHNELVEARDSGFTIVVAGHHETEAHAMLPLCGRLSEQFPEVEFIRADEPSPTLLCSAE